ncbi:MAG: murein biosynthesis integral membrane protein MurJ [Phycisphaerales bacterium]|nr:murein biosynthesis integral membrane protein MurJ [Phycisphaerales bacterium]
MTLLSRLGGLARDVLIGRIFGDTALGSAFSAGFTIPNLFRRLFGEGALSAAFIPEYAKAQREGREEADRFSSLTLVRLGIATGLLTAVAEIVLFAALVLLPPDPDRQMSIRLIIIMLPFMPFICGTAILGGMLQVHGKFGPAASGPLVLNGFIIAVGLWHLLRGEAGSPAVAYALGIATTVSGITQAATFAWLLRRHASWRADRQLARERVHRMWVTMIPVLIGLGTLQLNTFIDQLIAMWPIWVGPTVFGHPYPLDESSNIIIAAAQRLYQFPLGVFGIAVATAVFPLLSRHAADGERFADTLQRGLRISFYIGLPASAGLMLLNHDVVAALYASGRASVDGAAPTHGGFSDAGVARAAAVLAGFAPGVWAYSVNHVFARAFYARGDTRTPMRIAIGMVALNLALNLTLIWFLREAGLAWSTSICAAIQACILGRFCHTRLHAGSLNRDVLMGLARIVVATGIMAGVVWAVLWMMPAPQRWLDYVLRAGAGSIVGVAVYAGASLALRTPELRWLAHRPKGPGITAETSLD